MTLAQEIQVAARLLGRVLTKVGQLGELQLRVTREVETGRVLVDFSWNHSPHAAGSTWHHAIGGDRVPAAAAEYALQSLCKQLLIGDGR